MKEEIANGLPSGMYGFVLNTRRPLFEDRKLRQALTGLFDFEWANANLFDSAFVRTKSFYDKSELSSQERPASDGEKALLAPFPDAVTPEIMAGTWAPPITYGTGRDRAFLKLAYDQLTAAGYERKGTVLHSPSGAPVVFDVMLRDGGGQELVLAWQRTLARLGIGLTLSSVDTAQYQQRLTERDFDAILFSYSSSLSPGVEQVGRWGSAARDAPGSWNHAGVADPAVDAMIDAMLNARSREDFVDAVRAYDRVLLSGFWVVPLYHQAEQWVARWKRIARPETTPVYGYQIPSWWREPEEGSQ